jgi:hypothetical protein
VAQSINLPIKQKPYGYLAGAGNHADLRRNIER